MATYKKRNGDNFIKYLVIAFAVVFFGLLATLIGYNMVNKPLKYSQFDHITNFATIGAMPEDEYIVYYYSESCSYCKLIKTQVLEFAEDNNMDIPVYFIDAFDVSGTNPIPQMTGTPAMVVIVDGQVYDFVPGSVEITELIDEVNAGEYNIQ